MADEQRKALLEELVAWSRDPESLDWDYIDAQDWMAAGGAPYGGATFLADTRLGRTQTSERTLESGVGGGDSPPADRHLRCRPL